MSAWLLIALFAVHLYLKDGTYQVAGEYEVKHDRVRFFSTERGEWEELPLDLVDLKRTKAEQDEKETQRKEEKAANAAEEAALREMRREVTRVPPDPGVYWLNGKDLTPLKTIESKVNSNKRRTVLKVLSPLPVVAGKATLEIDGESAALAIANLRPEFYFRLSKDESFAIVRITPQKGVRIVEKWSIVPVTKELLQERETIEIFRHSPEEGLYKIWPQKPLAPGEYAFIQFIEGKGNTYVWDFRVTAPQ